VLRFKRTRMNALLDSITATGYGLTLGIHTRIDETIANVIEHAHVGNIYVNRNVIGAVVGVQPFGGEGLSGTGPKAGGPLYLTRLLATRPAGLPASLGDVLSFDVGAAEPAGASAHPHADPSSAGAHTALGALRSYRDWLDAQHDARNVARCDQHLLRPLAGATATLAGPTGERNTYSLRPRGTVLCVASTLGGARAQLVAVLATGNRALFAPGIGGQMVAALPAALKDFVHVEKDEQSALYDAVLFEGDSDELHALIRRVAGRAGPIVNVQGVAAGALDNGQDDYALERLLSERSVSVNTAAAGGNASLMTIG
jgi:RHH-type proline utilization regulon transcriptional repressor/proline dehydrogenase/delta 1-pyrroline-5-carboxylate dehydrogenase